MITHQSFSDLLKKLSDFKTEEKIAVAVSGGGDSMALAFLLSKYAAKNKIALHVLSVDHGLRKESAGEAKKVGGWVKAWPSVIFKTLKWTGEKPRTGIQEAARDARYKLMATYCRKQKIKSLFLAHHGDDQVETFLFRLAKGSGIDGLTVMQPIQDYEGLKLVRPLLDFHHDDLIEVCKKNKLDWIEDPSNQADRFARVRLRQSKEALEREGLTAERILTLAKRLDRARNALDQVTDKEEINCLLKVATQRIEIDLTKFLQQPKEIALRILQRSILKLEGKKRYPPKLQNIESMIDGIFDEADFRGGHAFGVCHPAQKIA